MKSKAISGMMLTMLLINVFWIGAPASAWQNVTKTLNGTVGATMEHIFSANDSIGQVSDTGIQSFQTEAFWWNKLVIDSKFSWDGLIERRDTFNPSYGNLTCRWSNPDHRQGEGPDDYLFPHLLSEGLAMYMITGNETYLDYARNTCDDMVYWMQDKDSKLIGYFKNSTGEIANEVTSLTHAYLPLVAYLASVDSDYLGLLEELANAILNYHMNNPEGNLAFSKVMPDGSNPDKTGYFVYGLVDGMLWTYMLTGNTSYLYPVRDYIVEWWNCRHTGTNLVYDSLYLYSGGGHNYGDSYEDFTRHYRCGAYLRACEEYYFLDQNSTILNIMKTYANALVTHVWDGDNWDYRTTVSTGSASNGVIEGNFPSLDYAMLLAYEITGNETYRNRAYEDYNSSFAVDELDFVNDLVLHACTDSGNPSSTQSCMDFAFNTIVPVTMWLYHDVADSSILNNMWELYNQTTYRHQALHYGYRRMIYYLNYNNDTTYPGARWWEDCGAVRIMPWLQFYVRPSPTVNITWVTFGNKKLYHSWFSGCFEVMHWFTNVTFSYAQQKIMFDEVTGSGKVTFNETITLALRDGSSYSNFSGSVLHTTSGSHSYEVWFSYPTIYIRADGSIDPQTAPISTVDNVTYAFTDNVNNSIVVERDNIVVDGTGYTLQGTGAQYSKGIDLTGRSNVTIKNTEIKAFDYGIYLSFGSSNNIIFGNNITNNSGGIKFSDSSNNTIYKNNIAANGGAGIWLHKSFNNIISGNNITEHGVGIYFFQSNNNTLSGNSITNYGNGTVLYFSSNNIISGNVVLNIVAIPSTLGIQLYYSSNNSLSGNNITNNESGVMLIWASNNTISGNYITENDFGIQLAPANDNTLRNNSIANNEYNFCVTGGSLSDFVNDVDTSNTVDGKPVYYWINQRDVVVSLDAGYVALVNCTRIKIENLTLKNNGQGVLLAYTTNSTITKNNITNNIYGISLSHSSNNSIYGNEIAINSDGIDLHKSSNNNIISGNNITDNGECGIWLTNSSDNLIYHNNFVDNREQVYSSDSINVWDDGYPSGGNYWSDFNCPDVRSGPYQNETGSDGIGDGPYVIDGDNRDRYPIVPYGYVPGPDLNKDGIVDIVDIVIVAVAYESQLGDPDWNPVADLDYNNFIDIVDIVIVAIHYDETYP